MSRHYGRQLWFYDLVYLLQVFIFIGAFRHWNEWVGCVFITSDACLPQASAFLRVVILISTSSSSGRNDSHVKITPELQGALDKANKGQTKDRNPSKINTLLTTMPKCSQTDYVELLKQTNKKSVVSNKPHRLMTLNVIEYVHDLKLDENYAAETNCVKFIFSTALSIEFSKTYEHKPQAFDKFLVLTSSGESFKYNSIACTLLAWLLASKPTNFLVLRM